MELRLQFDDEFSFLVFFLIIKNLRNFASIDLLFLLFLNISVFWFSYYVVRVDRIHTWNAYESVV